MNADDAMMIASRDWDLPRLNDAAGIDERWLHAFLALRIADLLAQVAVGDRLQHLPPVDRAWFKAQGEGVVVTAISTYAPLHTEAEAQMGIRDLDPDNDYQYDKTNQPSPRLGRASSSYLQECEDRAKRCLSFQPHAFLSGVCTTCNGPRYAHSPAARKHIP